MRAINRKAAVQFLIVLAAAAALKQFYSTASANELRWILWPTARLTEFITGVKFSFEPFAGYMSNDRSFLIASACAGVNCLIAVFLMLAVRHIWQFRSSGVRWRSLFFSAIAAYIVTTVANTLRISSSLWFNSSRPSLAGLDRGEIHRLDGIFIYFGFLLLIFLTAEKATGGSQVRFRTYLFPLGIYYLMTLAVPVANGALSQGVVFWQHAAFVIAAPIVLIATVAVPVKLFSSYAKRKDITPVGLLFPADASADEVCTRANIRDASAFSHRTIGLKCGAVIGDG